MSKSIDVSEGIKFFSTKAVRVCTPHTKHDRVQLACTTICRPTKNKDYMMGFHMERHNAVSINV